MQWLVFVVFGVLALTAAQLIQRTLLRDDTSDPIAFSIAFQFIAGISVFSFALLRGFSLPLDDFPLFNIVAVVALYTTVNVFLFLALKRIEISRFSVLYATGTAWTVLAAFIFLGERLTPLQLLGGLFIFSSLWLVRKVPEHNRRRWYRFGTGEVFALISAAALGIAVVNDGFLIANGIDVPSFTAFAFLAPATILAIGAPRSAKNALRLLSQPSLFGKTTLFSILYAAFTLSIYYAFLAAANVSLVAVLFHTQKIVLIVAGIIILKEHNSVVSKIVAMFVSFVGILLMLL